MKYEWNPEKNQWLKKERNISFEKIVYHLSQGDVWKISDHPDQKNYSGIQKKAMEMGIPYQTLISGVIHRYIEGDLKVKTG